MRKLCGIELTRTGPRTAFRTGRTGRAQVESPNETRRSDPTNLCGAQVRTPIPLVRPRTVPQTVGRGTGHTPDGTGAKTRDPPTRKVRFKCPTSNRRASSLSSESFRRIFEGFSSPTDGTRSNPERSARDDSKEWTPVRFHRSGFRSSATARSGLQVRCLPSSPCVSSDARRAHTPPANWSLAASAQSASAIRRSRSTNPACNPHAVETHNRE